MDKFHSTYSDKLSGLFKSDLWHIIKFRANQYITTLEKTALDKLSAHELDNAQWYAAQATGVKTLLDIAERIPSELIKGQLVVDDALGVIENKPRIKEKSWIHRTLEKLRNQK